MKKCVIFILILLLGIGVNAQTKDSTFRNEGSIYYSSSKKQVTVEKETGFTWVDSKNVEYPIYISNSGSCYIKKVSSKTGKSYKQYLNKEVSIDICKKLGVEYKSNK